MKWVCWLLLLILSPAFAAAELLSDPQLGGSLKSLNLYLDRSPVNPEVGLISSERLRLDFTSRVAKDYPLQISVEHQLLWSDPVGLVGPPADSINRLVDWEKSWEADEQWSAQLQLDRLNISGESAALHWTLGRQAIGFGLISIFSPLDVIAPFAPDAIDVDVRPGVDAVKLVRYFGLAGQFGGVAVFGDQPEHNSYLLTLGGNPGNLDLLVLTGSLRDRQMIGGGMAGELGSLGLKGEVSWYRGTRVGQPGGDLYADFAIAAVEGWYRFDNDLVLLVEYLYNGAGSNQPRDYPLVAASAPLQEGLSFLLGRHYLLLGPSYELHPLVTASGLLIHNLGDNSSLIRPQLAISLADNLQLDLFWAATLGDKPHSNMLTGQPIVRSEFGTLGDSGGLLLRWYF
ncbi:MAG TPA: hypothetical protein VIR78_05635 [Malonomonas sp.]